MTRFTLHVPESYNDGDPVDLAYLATVEGRILDAAGGFTLTHGIGAWRGDGTTYREPVRLYAVDADPEVGPILATLAADIARDLAQEAVYLTAQDIAPELVYAPAGVQS